jgi:hypothetical protein
MTLVLALAAVATSIASPPINEGVFGGGPAQGLEFEAARLGMSLADWKGLPNPAGGPYSRAQADCRAAAGDLTVCSYETHYGDFVLPQSFPLNSQYQAHELKYYFTNGRLSRVEFLTSIDAFNDIVAALEAKYGPASQTIRDQTPPTYSRKEPRVQKIWRLASGVVRVVDPSSRENRLIVQISGSNATAAQTAARAEKSSG